MSNLSIESGSFALDLKFEKRRKSKLHDEAQRTSPYARLLFGDCLTKLAEVDSNSVDLIFTSPPYANRRASTYGGIKPDEYVEWFMSIADELQRVLKPTGTFVLNIKEPAINGERHTHVIELILEMRNRGWL